VKVFHYGIKPYTQITISTRKLKSYAGLINNTTPVTRDWFNINSLAIISTAAYIVQQVSPCYCIYVHDKTSRNAILLMIQEVKRDIIFRRMNLPPSAQQITDPRRLAAHLDSTIRTLRSYLQYIGLVKYMKAVDLLLRLQEFNLA
jgi:hypothetical protein